MQEEFMEMCKMLFAFEKKEKEMRKALTRGLASMIEEMQELEIMEESYTFERPYYVGGNLSVSTIVYKDNIVGFYSNDSFAYVCANDIDIKTLSCIYTELYHTFEF